MVCSSPSRGWMVVFEKKPEFIANNSQSYRLLKANSPDRVLIEVIDRQIRTVERNYISRTVLSESILGTKYTTVLASVSL